MKAERHRWEKETNHPYCHVYYCVKCGCKKDHTAMLNMFYEDANGRHDKAPPCPGKLELSTINTKGGEG